MSRAEDLIQTAYSQLGAPYVFGMWGQQCTVANRKKYAGYNPSHKSTIYKTCPVLSGKQSSCAGCKWCGWRAFDCRGFTHWCLEQIGIVIYGDGATTQYETKSNWDRRGLIANMPDCVCCVFEKKGAKMSHTGFHIGGGADIHCSGCVKVGSLNDRKWTHYAIPAGLYEGGITTLTVLKTGSKGDAVKKLQEQLKQLGYYPYTIDGDFGARTQTAVRGFQNAHGLTVDGIAGAITQTAIAQAIAQKNGSADDKLDNAALFDKLTAARAKILIAQNALTAADQTLLELLGG